MPKRKRYSSFRYSKRRRFGRRYRRSSRFRRYTRRPRTLRSRVKALEKGVEWKYAEATQQLTPSQNFTGVTLLPRIDAGPGTGTEADRIGDEITARFLQTRVVIKSGDASNKCRIVIVKYPQSTGASGIQDVMQFPTALVGDNRLPVQSLYKKESPVKFKILYDRLHSTNTTTSEYKVLNIKVPLPKTGLKLYYPDSSTVYPTKNLIDVYACTDSAVIPHPIITFNTRLTYVDS